MYNSLIACAIYYYLWISVIPKLRGYRIRQEVLRLEDGAQSHKLVKVPVAKLAEWDATHDAVGRPLNDSVGRSDLGSAGEKVGDNEEKPASADETPVEGIQPDAEKL